MARRGWSTSNFFRYAGADITAAPLTIAAWAKTSVTGTVQEICGVYNSAGSGLTASQFSIEVAGTDVVRARTSDGATSIAATSTTISANTWFHACGVFAAANSRAAYLNGGGKGTQATSRTPLGINRTSVGLCDNTTSTLPLSPSGTGDIADVTFWNIALSDADVASLALGIHPFLVHPEAIVGYWPLIGAYSPEINFKSNVSVLTMQGTLTTAAHPRIFRHPTKVEHAW